MEIDNKLKNELLSMSNSELMGVIDTVAKAAGISGGKLKISESDMSKIRDAITNATDKDAKEAIKMIGGDEKVRQIIDKAKNRL